MRERESLVSAATNLEIKGDTRNAYALEKGIPKVIAKDAIGVTKPFFVYASASSLCMRQPRPHTCGGIEV